MGKQVTDFVLYRWRYVLGYSVIALIVMLLVYVAGFIVPGGLSAAEMQTTVTSDRLSTKDIMPQMAVNLPYHLVQRIGFELWGVSHLTIKLPSLLLGTLSILGLFLLLQAWFRRNVSVIATAIAVTSGGYILFLTQSGTPDILYVFWPVWLLVAALKVSRQAKLSLLWKIILFATATLSLYTPLGVYILITLGTATIFHPHLRYLVKQISKPRLFAGLLISIILLAPLGYALWLQPTLILSLVGAPDHWPAIAANALHIFREYFDIVSPSTGIVLSPIYGIATVLIILLGCSQLFRLRYTARSYIIIAWIILLVPAIIVSGARPSVMFIPFILLLAAGVDTLIRRWYTLFPNNPYARVIGLVPLSILIGGVLISGTGRYLYSYQYSPETVRHFSFDLPIVQEQLARHKKLAIVVPESQRAFYTVVAHHGKGLEVRGMAPSEPLSSPLLIAGALQPKAHNAAAIITDHRSIHANRFYLYKPEVK